MASRALAFVIWAAVAASVIFWLLRMTSVSSPVPPHAVTVGEGSGGRGDLSRLFGREAVAPATGAAPSVGAAMKLIGVVAPRAGSGVRAGVALISIEGKPPRPYRVGAQVDPQLVLLAVHQRGASLGPRDGAPTLKLELPALPPPATGTLKAAGLDGAAPAFPSMQPAPPAPQRLPPRMRLPAPVEPPAAEQPPDEPPQPPHEEPEPQPDRSMRPQS
jgi:general secretion pathway protein C